MYISETLAYQNHVEEDSYNNDDESESSVKDDVLDAEIIDEENVDLKKDDK